MNATTGFTPFYANHLHHPALTATDGPDLSGGGMSIRSISSLKHFAASRESLILQIRKTVAAAQLKQAEQVGITNHYEINDLVKAVLTYCAPRRT